MRKRVTAGLTVIASFLALLSFFPDQHGDLPARLRLVAAGIAYFVGLINFVGSMQDDDRRV